MKDLNTPVYTIGRHQLFSMFPLVVRTGNKYLPYSNSYAPVTSQAACQRNKKFDKLNENTWRNTSTSIEASTREQMLSAFWEGQ